MDRNGTPNWQAAVARAKAPTLPEVRFNQVHGYHGEFGQSENTAKQMSGSGGQASAPGGAQQQSSQALPVQSKAGLLAEAARLDALAKVDLEKAANIQNLLAVVLSELKQLTAPFSSSTAASGSGSSSLTTTGPASASTISGTATGSAASGTPSQSPQAQGTATYADQVATLQGQASAYTSQIASLQQEAANYQAQAASLRAEANATGGTQ